MHVIGVLAGRVAAAAVRPPAGAGQPDLLVPDHVEHTEPVGIEYEECRQVVAVVAGLTDGIPAVAARVDREVAGPAARILTAVFRRPVAGNVPGETGGLGLAESVGGTRGDRPAGDRLIHRATLRRPAAISVARRGLRYLGGRGAEPGDW